MWVLNAERVSRIEASLEVQQDIHGEDQQIADPNDMNALRKSQKFGIDALIISGVTIPKRVVDLGSQASLHPCPKTMDLDLQPIAWRRFAINRIAIMVRDLKTPV